MPAALDFAGTASLLTNADPQDCPGSILGQLSALGGHCMHPDTVKYAWETPEPGHTYCSYPEPECIGKEFATHTSTGIEAIGQSDHAYCKAWDKSICKTSSYVGRSVNPSKWYPNRCVPVTKSNAKFNTNAHCLDIKVGVFGGSTPKFRQLTRSTRYLGA